jgi:hypothetical protein
MCAQRANERYGGLGRHEAARGEAAADPAPGGRGMRLWASVGHGVHPSCPEAVGFREAACELPTGLARRAARHRRPAIGPGLLRAGEAAALLAEWLPLGRFLLRHAALLSVMACENQNGPWGCSPPTARASSRFERAQTDDTARVGATISIRIRIARGRKMMSIVSFSTTRVTAPDLGARRGSTPVCYHAARGASTGRKSESAPNA